jgi:hypothetical protein
MGRDRLFVTSADHQELPADSTPDVATDFAKQEEVMRIRLALVALAPCAGCSRRAGVGDSEEREGRAVHS